MRIAVTWTLITAILTSPAASIAATPPAASPKSNLVELKNVQLAPGEVLHGVYINDAGRPLAGVPVTITLDKVAHKVVTDKSGRFSVSGLHGGRGIAVIGKDTFAFRLWTNRTAPPKSLRSVALVSSGGKQVVVRGQNDRSLIDRIRCLSTEEKICLGLLVAGGTAIAIAASQDDDAS